MRVAAGINCKNGGTCVSAQTLSAATVSKEVIPIKFKLIRNFS